MVGRPLSCDEQTYNCTRLEYARVCVEIDAALPFIREFDIDNPLFVDPITVTVDYEWKPTRCDKCKVFSHSCTSTATLKQQPTSSKGKGIVGAPNQPHNPVDLGNTTPTPPFATLIDPFSSITKAIPSATLDKGKGMVGVTVPPTSAVMDQTIPTSALPIPKPVLNTITSTNLSLLMDPQSPHPLPLTTNPTTTSPAIPLVPHDPLIAERYNSCQESDTAPPLCNIDNDTGHQAPSFLDNAPCQESKMDSLGTHSESTHVVIDTTGETSSTSIAAHDASPSSSPKTTRKKKGGRKRKEVKYL